MYKYTENISTIMQANNKWAITGAPALQDVNAYCQEKGYPDDGTKFFEYYEKKNWLINGDRITSWKALLDSWMRREAIMQTPKTKYTKEHDFMNDKEFKAGIRYMLDHEDEYMERLLGKKYGKQAI